MYVVHEGEGYQLLQIDLHNSLKNYNYILHLKESEFTVAIDPTDAAVTRAALTRTGWRLDAICTTHHHADHVGGNADLQLHYACPIYGNGADAARIPCLTHPVYADQRVMLGGVTWQVMDVSGHTIGHIAYYIPECGVLFAGDTVFSMGCGRLFEGTAAMMQDAFARISALPPETLLCISHEYTLDNGYFALSIDPHNAALRKRMEEVEKLRAFKQPTVPVMLATERATNPFFRCENAAIKKQLGMEQDASSNEVFGRLRALKDSFKRS
jgi:hydroxyacylglutathione hydrolase